jgi:hypothetical protein
MFEPIEETLVDATEETEAPAEVAETEEETEE